MHRKKSITIQFYRVSRWFYTHYLKILGLIIYRLNYILFNCVIPPTAKLGDNVIFGHSVGIVIHDKATIGDNTKIYQHVTIGGQARNIGSNCIIGTGAVVIADVGNNVKIGANAVVLEPIPDNCIAVGIPARIINKSESK